MSQRRVIRIPIILLLMICAWTQLNPALAQTENATAIARTKHQSRRVSVGDLWARTDLYFGSGKPDGTAVTEQEFKQFLDEVVTPRFPDGLTLLVGLGQFRNQGGSIIQERSMVLILLYPKRNSATNARIEEIRELYKNAFQQESVLRVDTKGRVSF